MSGANFGMEGTLAEKFHVYAQAVADLAGLSNGTMHDITIACANIARDLGANELDLQSTSSVREVCALASARIDAYFGSDGEFSTAGSLTIDYQSPTCSASIDARAQVRLATALASLEANLPELLVAVEARGTRFVATAEDSLDAGIDIVRNPGALGVEGSACFLRIGAAGASAVGQLKASIEAAAMVTGSLDLG